MCIPVTDENAIEAETIFQYVREQAFVAMHFRALPARERGHHRLCTSRNCRGVSSSVDVAKLFFGGAVVALVTTLERAAIAHVMLRSGDDVVAFQEIRAADGALQASHHRSRVFVNDLRTF